MMAVSFAHEAIQNLRKVRLAIDLLEIQQANMSIHHLLLLVELTAKNQQRLTFRR